MHIVTAAYVAPTFGLLKAEAVSFEEFPGSAGKKWTFDFLPVDGERSKPSLILEEGVEALHNPILIEPTGQHVIDVAVTRIEKRL